MEIRGVRPFEVAQKLKKIYLLIWASEFL